MYKRRRCSFKPRIPSSLYRRTFRFQHGKRTYCYSRFLRGFLKDESVGVKKGWSDRLSLRRVVGVDYNNFYQAKPVGPEELTAQKINAHDMTNSKQSALSKLRSQLYARVR